MQYVLKHADYGHLLRALPGLFGERPEDLTSIAQDELFWTFFPLTAALRQGLLRPVGNVDVPADRRRVPLMRAGTRNPDTGRVDLWWLWNGEDEWQVEDLSDDVRAASPRGIVNDTLLKERLAAQWRPGDDLLLRPVEPRAQPVGTGGPTTARHFTYWRDEPTARTAATLMSGPGRELEIRPPASDDDARWLVRVTTAVAADDQMDDVTNDLERICSNLGGEYDGHEIAVA